MNYFNHGWGMGFGWLITLVTIVGIFYLFQEKKKKNSSAQDILDKRFARGDLSIEEYEEKSKLLRNKKTKG